MHILRRVSQLILAFALALLRAATAYATDVGGTISTNTTWATAGSPYVVTADIWVNEGVTLTIQPGVQVRFNLNRKLTVDGTLMAVGTPADSIVFTSSFNPAYPGDWKCVMFNDNSSVNSLMRYCVVLYGGANSEGAIQFGAREYYGSYPSGSPVRDTRIALSGSAGLYSWNASYAHPSPLVERCRFENNTGEGVRVAGTNLTLNNCTFIGNTGFPVYASNSNIAGSSNQFLDGNRRAIRTEGNVDWNQTWGNLGVPYYVVNSFQVNEGSTLTLVPGDILKFAPDRKLTLDGCLVAAGSLADSIYFTSSHDDDLGGDTEGDADNTGPSANDWRSIHYYDNSSVNSLMRYCVVLYGGANNEGAIQFGAREYYSAYPSGSPVRDTRVAFSGSAGLTAWNASNAHPSPMVERCRFESNLGEGVRVMGTNLTLNNCEFIGNTGYPMYASNSGITGTGNQFLDASRNAIRTDGNVDWSQTWGNLGVPYYVFNDFTINEGATLTLAMGGIYKFAINKRITADGNLFAVGSPSDSIVFTSARDDSRGGDTNGDGGGTAAAPGDWKSVYFYDNSSVNSLMRYCVVLYGGANNEGAIQFGAREYYSAYPSGSPVRDTRIALSGSAGLYSWNASYAHPSPLVERCRFESNAGGGVRAFGSNLTLNNCGFFGNTGYPIYASNSNIAGAGNLFLDANRQAIRTEGNVDWNQTWGNLGVPYYVVNSFQVNEGVTLTLAPGDILKFAADRKLTLDGNLFAVGTPTDSIYFTSAHDDSRGGDTEGDGANSTPAPGDWRSVYYFDNTSVASLMRYCVALYGGANNEGAIHFAARQYYGDYPSGSPVRDSRVAFSAADGIASANAGTARPNPTLEHVVVSQCLEHGVNFGSGNGSLSYSCLIDNGQNGIHVGAGSNPVLQNNTMDGNGNCGLYIENTNPPVINHIITNNTTYGIRLPAGYVADSLHHNDVFANVAGNYAGIGDQTGAHGNIAQDPLYVNRPLGNYHLEMGSPCVDAGDPTIYDLDGSCSDMGAFPFTLDLPVPADLVVIRQDWDIFLGWGPDESGLITAYVIYYEQQDNENWDFLAATTDTSYVHQDVLRFAPSMYYQVVGTDIDIGLINRVAAPGMSRSSFEAALRKAPNSKRR